MAIKTSLIDGNQAEYTAEEFSIFQTLLLSEGVLNFNGNNTDWKVVQHAAGANMSVDIGLGAAFISYLKAGVTWTVGVRNNAVINKAISNNVSGSNRVDAVIIHLKQTEPNQLKNNVGEILVVTGSSPSALSDAAINTAVGDTNWYRLANVTVANAAVTIVNANISDQRNLLTIGPFKIINVDEVQAGQGANGVLINNETRFVEQSMDMAERGTKPSTPTTNHWKFYFKPQGAFIEDDAGVEYQLTVASNFYIGGDGSDGALNIPSGTTTLNLNQVYNFSSINIASGATLAFTGTNGSALVNCSGNCVTDGTVELRGLITTRQGVFTNKSIFVQSGTPMVVPAPNVGGIGGTGSANGGAGGTSTSAGAGSGGTAPGGAGAGGGSLGGAGGGASQAVNGTAASGNNGGAGANETTHWNSGAGGGGGGFNTGNGGNGGNNTATASAANVRGLGGSGGASGANGGNGGNGGKGGSPTSSNFDGGHGGTGGWGYAQGGNGGAGGDFSGANNGTSGNGGAGGHSSYGTGGNGGAGGNRMSPDAGTAGNGGRGGDGRTGGNGGIGGTCSVATLGLAGNGGRGGDGRTGAAAFILNVAGNLTFSASASINGQGGNGGNGGDGGNAPSNSGNNNASGRGGIGGDGGNGGDGSDVFMAALGTVTNAGTINNLGGTGGTQGVGGANNGSLDRASSGSRGQNGKNGLMVICQVKLM